MIGVHGAPGDEDFLCRASSARERPSRSVAAAGITASTETVETGIPRRPPRSPRMLGVPVRRLLNGFTRLLQSAVKLFSFFLFLFLRAHFGFILDMNMFGHHLNNICDPKKRQFKLDLPLISLTASSVGSCITKSSNVLCLCLVCETTGYCDVV